MTDIDHPGELAEDLHDLVEEGQTHTALQRLADLHPADQADVVERLPPETRETLLQALQPPDLADILEHLDEDVRAETLRELEPETLGPTLDHLDDDVAADIIQQLPPEEGREVLELMASREDVEELLEHHEETAGGLMTGDVMSLQADWSVDWTIAYLRQIRPGEELPYYLYVVEESGQLIGVVSLRQLIIAQSEQKLRDLMTPKVFSVLVNEDQEVVAEKMRRYNLLALPVVDRDGRLVGQVTADDVLDVQVEEATEDMYRQAGMEPGASALSPLRVALARRIPWLVTNLLTASVSAYVVTQFEETIAKASVLAAFMPIIAGHGGNTGTQTTTLVVRGLALGELRTKDIFRILRKEISFGMVYGCVAGVLAATIAYLFTANIKLTTIVGLAMIGNVIVAGLVGVLIPMGFRGLKLDPALASAMWLTTFTDICGFIMLLGLGSHYLRP